MSSIIIDLAGKKYDMSCDDDQKPYLTSLAKTLEEYLLDFKEQFGNLNHEQLIIMAAMAILDEKTILEQKLNLLKPQLSEADDLQNNLDFDMEQIADIILKASNKIEQLAYKIAKFEAEMNKREN